jgi:hypothetical protein
MALIAATAGCLVAVAILWPGHQQGEGWAKSDRLDSQRM